MDKVIAIVKEVCPEYGTELCQKCGANTQQGWGTCLVETTVIRLLQLGYSLRKDGSEPESKEEGINRQF